MIGIGCLGMKVRVTIVPATGAIAAMWLEAWVAKR